MAAWPENKKKEFRKAHQVLMPERQPNHNYPHADVEDYFNSIFNTDNVEYKGMVSIVAIDKFHTTPSIVAVVPADQLGEWASRMHVSTKKNYYYGKAQHSGNATWGNEGTFAYNAIYVDIDAHNCGVKGVDQELLDYMAVGLDIEGKTAPNFIEASGRGYHLVWLINQVPTQLGWMVKAVSQDYAETVKQVLAQRKYDDFHVDFAYASNIAGLTRIPGTFNTSSGTYSILQKIHDERLDLAREYEGIPAQKNVFHPRGFSVNDIGQKRLQALLELVNIRPGTELRDLLCYHIFSAAQMAGMSDNDALALAQNVNKTFKTPYREREIERMLSTAKRKRYHFKNSTIIRDLEITEDEQQAIGLFPNTMKRDTNRARKARVAARKAQRDKKIMRQHLRGLTASEIAKKVGHAYNTIRSVITKYSNDLTALFSASELKRLAKERARQVVELIRVGKAAAQSDNPVFKNRSAKYYAYTNPCLRGDDAGKDVDISDGLKVPWGEVRPFLGGSELSIDVETESTLIAMTI